VVWEREKVKNPLRNESLKLAVVFGILEFVLTLVAISAASSGQHGWLRLLDPVFNTAV
jgi:hypothetical protein